MTARKRASRKKPAAAKPARTKMTTDIDADLLRELRVVSLEVPLRAIGGSLSALTERALRGELAALRQKYNRGKRFEAEGPVHARRGPRPKV